MVIWILHCSQCQLFYKAPDFLANWVGDFAPVEFGQRYFMSNLLSDWLPVSAL